MTCTAQELTECMDEFSGGSLRRFAHPFNKAFVYSEGVHSAVTRAEAFWLVDIVATEHAPLFARAFEKGETGIGVFTLEVHESPVDGVQARISLSLDDDAPEVGIKTLGYTSFPAGKWEFFLGMDSGTQLGLPAKYVTVMYLPQEH